MERLRIRYSVEGQDHLEEMGIEAEGEWKYAWLDLTQVCAVEPTHDDRACNITQRNGDQFTVDVPADTFVAEHENRLP